MLDIANSKAVFLDHSYCKKAVFDVKFTQDSTTTKEQKMADSFHWGEFDVEFQPPSPHSDIPLSALSPSHSIDSGFGNEMNLFAEFGGMDLDSVMESILNTDMNANIPNQKRQTQENSKQPAPSVKVASSRPKVKEGMDETDKNQKNAIAARENRLKKKKHLEGMEKELEQLKQENAALKAKDRRYDQVVGKLRNEVSYLKNVIANESTLSVLVQRLVTTPGITFTSSLLSQGKDERPTTEDKSDADDVMIDDEPNDAEPPSQTDNCKEKVRNFIQKRYQTRGTKRSASAAESSSTGRKKARNDEVNGGVCLHVGQGKVSLEFCSQCSMNANGNSQH